MSLLTIKILAGVAILVVALIGGLVPILAARHRGSLRFFSLGNAFAGGLFLGVGFLHLLPEGIEKLEEIVEYPLAPLLAALGVGVLLMIDRVIFRDEHVELISDSPQSGSFYPYVLLGILSIHSIIAGIALGLDPHISTSVILILGLLCHKGSAAFALMVSIHMAGLEERRQKTMLATFVSMTPLGILIGMVASAAFLPVAVDIFDNDILIGMVASVALGEGNATLIEGSFNALAAGTFIYVAIIDIIDESLSRRNVQVAKYVLSALVGEDDVPMPTKDHDRVIKFALIMLGIALIGVLVHLTHLHGAHGYMH